MTLTLTRRVLVEKNSQQKFRVGNRTIISTSKVYKTWHASALSQLMAMQHPTRPLDGSIRLTIFYLKGKFDADLDDPTTSICDVLTDAEVIADDKHVTELHRYRRPGASEFVTAIKVVKLPT